MPISCLLFYSALSLSHTSSTGPGLCFWVLLGPCFIDFFTCECLTCLWLLAEVSENFGTAKRLFLQYVSGVYSTGQVLKKKSR